MEAFMSVQITKNGKLLKIKIGHARIDGRNLIKEALDQDQAIQPDVSEVEFDMEAVDYINSTGVTEIIGIHRKFHAISGPSIKIRFIHVSKKVMTIFELVEMYKIAEVVPIDA